MNALAKKHCQNLRQTYRPRQRGEAGPHQRLNTYSQCQRTKSTGGVERRPPKPVSTSTPIRPIPPGPFHVRGVGGGERVRTDDILLAKQVLSQLSYAPIRGQKSGIRYQLFLIPDTRSLIMVGLGRLELPTSRLSGVRSNRLSYRPEGRFP